MELAREELTVSREKAVLVSVSLPDKPFGADPFEELRGLAYTAGATVLGELTQKRQYIVPATYIGKGKLEELQNLVELTGADVILFDNDLSPAQIRNLEKTTGVKVLDRSELILDIFATRARTVEARLQVELAQLEYALPRLKKMWTHLSRMEGGIGMRGPGETQLEEDRRLVGKRISDLKTKLREIQSRKEREVRSRASEYTLSLVGYTNAGKSTLMNSLTGANMGVEDKLFSTLDTRTRKWHIPGWGKVLLSDTVGFIRDLPHHLVASFKATLEETRQARLLLHVVDASNPDVAKHIDAVKKVLQELDCEEKPTLLVLNKADRVADPSILQSLAARHPRSVAISAAKKTGLEQLREIVVTALSNEFSKVSLEIPAGNGKVLAFLASHTEILRQEFRDDKALVTCSIPKHLVHKLAAEDVRITCLEDTAKTN
ncbi:MAG: GTPase HflX [Gemmataceae bacterium]|nr:GTPase HflX [Gemmataceae bacterium]